MFWPAAAIVVPAVGWFAKIEIEGAEHLPEDGSYVLAPNHYSEFDPVIVAVATWRMGRAPRFMAKESLFRVPVLGALLRATGMVPVARASSAGAAKQTIEGSEAATLDHDQLVVVKDFSVPIYPGLAPLGDRDAATRSVLDAVAGLGPLQQYLDDPEVVEIWLNSPSEIFVIESMRRVEEAGFRLGNISVQVVAERPRIAPRRDELQAHLSALLRAPVSVSGTTADGVGIVGAGEGIQVIAVAQLFPR